MSEEAARKSVRKMTARAAWNNNRTGTETGQGREREGEQCVQHGECVGASVPVDLIYLGVDWRSLRRTGPTVNKSGDLLRSLRLEI